jgi:hypothetical protein
MILSSGRKSKKGIKKIQATGEVLTARAGLGFVSQYIESQEWLMEMLQCCDWKGSRKGLHSGEQLRQFMLNCIDGTATHLSVFDERCADPSYALLIGADKLLSTSSAKRMLAHTKPRTIRRMIEMFFMKRLKKEKAPYIKLDLDTVVFENDSSQTREGCSVTYKRVKGFQPLMIKWNGYVVAAQFREGKAHSNHGDDALNMISHVVSVVRKAVSVPIVLTADGGFFDQEIMKCCEKLKVGYIIGGKQYKNLRERVQSIPEDEFSIFRRDDDSLHEWYYTEFMDKRDNWDTERRLVVTQLRSIGDQMIIPGMGRMSLSYTNLGTDPELMRSFEDAGVDYLAQTENIIMLAHNRGEDELAHRHIKDFATREQFPCKDFDMNRAYFEIMILAFNLYESFKRDCLDGVIPATSYPEKFRRKFIDTAGRIVKTARRTILAIPKIVMEQLSLEEVWQKAVVPA